MSRVSPIAHENPPTAPAARVHRMRTARGACWVIVVGAAGAAGLVLVDAAATLPGWVRGFGLATWLTAVGVLTWRFVVRPWRESRATAGPVPSARQELPGNLRAAAAAALSLAVCLLVATLLPGAADHLRRVAFPWQRGAVSNYRVVVTSGAAVVARGGTVTLSAYAETFDPALPPSAKATFVIRAPARESRVAVHANDGGEFHLTRVGVGADFEYRVEVEGAASEWFTVTAIDAVHLAPGTTTTLLPPGYAPGAAKRVTPGFAALEGFPQATAEFRFRFDRPASVALLEFLPPGAPLEHTPVALSSDGLSGTASFRLRQDGVLRLVLIAEENGKKLRTESPTSVRVNPDRPPRFTVVRGVSPRPATARPGESLAIEVAAIDDIAVGGAALEYSLEGSGPRSVSIPLAGAGTAQASGRLEFPLPPALGEGGTMRLRLRVADTRHLDDPELRPQVSYYPAEGWLTLRADPAAPPLAEQEIAGRCDAVRESLAAALKEVRDARENAEAVLAEDKGQPALATEHTVRLGNAREAAGRAAGLLREAAREADLNAELRPLADAARTVAGRFARDVDDALRRAAASAPADRPTDLATSVRLLSNGSEQIDGILARNNSLARDRLDARALAALAAEASALADRLAKSPAEDARTAHRELLARFQRLLADSESLRAAIDGARYQEFQRLAADATELASSIQSLNAAAKRLHAESRARLLGRVATEQEALAGRAVALLARIETAARLANLTPPKAERFRRIPDLLTRGRTLEALTEMAGAADALVAVAETFEKWAVERGDAKAAARQLALWQDDLRTRLRAATAGVAANFATLPDAAKARFRDEQAAIAGALASLRLPPGQSARAARDDALKHVRSAGEFLRGSGDGADRAMEIAAGELKRFADQLPTAADRLGRTRAEFEKLWRAQEPIQTAAEQALRNIPDPAALAGKLTPLADRQKAQLAAFEALDLPGMEARRARVLAALAAAAGDLAAALPQDAQASQLWVRRELDWVRMILSENAPPPDDRADEIARRLAAAAKAVEALGLAATDSQLAAHAATLQESLRQLNQFPACPEAPTLLNEARDAVQAADAVFRNGSPLVEKLRKLHAAAAAAGRLANRLTGAESDLDRLRRLAAARRAGAALAAATREKKENPPPLAADVARQLGREAEELTHTRVGPAGQLHKKRALALYAQLKDHPTPERVPGVHADLATALEELAALAADVADLTASFDRTAPPAAPAPSDPFLPSRALADQLRDLARSYRASRERVTDLPGELARRLKPTDAKPLPGLEEKQRALTGEVAALAEKLAARQKLWPAHPDEVRAEAAAVADRLRDGSPSAAKDAAGRAAALLRQLSTDAAAKAAAPLAARQEAIEKELAALLDSPGAAAARQRQRSAELSRELTALIQALEGAARDAGPDEATATALTGAADTAKVAAKLLAESERVVEVAKFDDAAALRGEAEANLRAAAGVVAGAGPAATMLANPDTQLGPVGDALRRADAALRQAGRHLDGKPDAAAAAKQVQTVAGELDRAARATAARLAAGR